MRATGAEHMENIVEPMLLIYRNVNCKHARASSALDRDIDDAKIDEVMETTYLQHVPIRGMKLQFDVPFDKRNPQDTYISFGLQRSGQHVIIDWICRGFVDAIHLNHCRFFKKDHDRVVLSPKRGRRVIYTASMVHDSKVQGRNNYERSLPASPQCKLLYSLEDIRLSDAGINHIIQKYHHCKILILRDPANWLASSIQLRRFTKETLAKKVAVLKEYLEFANRTAQNRGPNWLVINFNRFIEEPDYRRELGRELQIKSFEMAEEALKLTPTFGGGSSFRGEDDPASHPLNRWVKFSSDPFFLSTLSDSELIAQSEYFFGKSTGISQLRS